MCVYIYQALKINILRYKIIRKHALIYYFHADNDYMIECEIGYYFTYSRVK